MKPLVSILIPAFNMQDTIVETVRSAVAQTWSRKEIIVVDDGSSDATAERARQFASKNVKVVSTDNRGLSAAVNLAYRLCQGEYIQELDADDMLGTDKIERQLAAVQEADRNRRVLSSPWASFFYRTSTAQFIPNSLWADLTPAEFLLRKMSDSLHMQNATWLVSRELAEAAGPWDETLEYDQDGEYFSRVLLASEGTRFVPEGRVFYRVTGPRRVSYLGNSIRKRQSLLRSIKLHVQYLRSVEESERVRHACVTYLQTRYGHFYPHHPSMAEELRVLANQLHGELETPQLRRKYAWIEPVLGWKAAKWNQDTLPQLKSWMARYWDWALYRLQANERGPA